MCIIKKEETSNRCVPFSCPLGFISRGKFDTESTCENRFEFVDNGILDGQDLYISDAIIIPIATGVREWNVDLRPDLEVTGPSGGQVDVLGKCRSCSPTVFGEPVQEREVYSLLILDVGMLDFKWFDDGSREGSPRFVPEHSAWD